jgi:hypothetical protein
LVEVDFNHSGVRHVVHHSHSSIAA